jgi:hypothetical protein
MRFTPTTVRSSNASRPGERQELGRWLLIATLLAVGSVGCGPAEEFQGMPEELGTQEQEEGGIITNGIINTGLSVQGITNNGLLSNGLTNTTLASAEFSSWFEQNLDRAPAFMNYAVRCAVPQGQTRTYTSPRTGSTYTWTGSLGLTPSWSSGSQATLLEQQVVSACLAAHTNKFGVHITLAMLGTNAQGVELMVSTADRTTYSEPEACFFGNVFTTTGTLYAANDRKTLKLAESTARACGLSSRNVSTDCQPINHVGSCSTYCTKDATGTYYTSCTYGGVTYKPFTTRIRPADIYTCGDGVCQFTEKCGTGSSYDSCAADCGACQ